MSTKSQKNRSPMSEVEFRNLLNLIAVEQGLRLPNTAEEISVFEEKFANEIRSAMQSKPSLEDLLSFANRLDQTGVEVIKNLEDPDVGERYQMAAREGNSINSKIEERMNSAIDKERKKLLDK